MKQFDVVSNPFLRSRERQPFLVTLQSDLLMRSLDTIVVAPLELAGSGTYADRLNPRVEIEGQRNALQRKSRQLFLLLRFGLQVGILQIGPAEQKFEEFVGCGHAGRYRRIQPLSCREVGLRRTAADIDD